MSSRCLPTPRILSVAFIMLAVCILLLAGTPGVQEAAPAIAPVQTEPVLIQAAGRGNPYVNFQDGRAIPASFPNGTSLASALAGSTTKGLALASADFDEDGMPDLVASYDTTAGGMLSLHFGNVDAVYPNAPEAKERRAKGTFVDAPFLPDAKLFETPERPDFIGAGDFDADGHWDVAAASLGGTSLAYHRGDGAGALLPPERLPLPGAVTAMVTSDVNRRDGLEDVLVGVVTPSGAQLLVFEWPEGALRGKPEVIALPEPATGLASGQLDTAFTIDAVAAAGKHVVIVTGRDRRLTLPEASRAAAGTAKAMTYALPFELSAVALGDYDADGEAELALLAANGGLRIVGLADLEADPSVPGDPVTSLASEETEGARLLTARSSSLAGEDLVVLLPASRSMRLLSPAPSTSGGVQSDGGMPWITTLDTAHPAAAALPLRLNSDALADLICLSAGPAELSSLETAPLAVFTVVNTNDSGAGSLRAAIVAANAATSTDIIAFDIPGPGPHTIQPLTPLPAITSGGVSIDGTTEPDFGSTPVIVLDGSLAPISAPALHLQSNSNVIRGLVINRFTRATFAAAGIFIESADKSVIEGNFIGTDVTGLVVQQNEGIAIQVLTSQFATIGGTVPAARNVLSGNVSGVYMGLAATPGSISPNNTVSGNYIGTGVDGRTILGNSFTGITMLVAPNSTAGGTTAGSRNVVCDHSFLGIDVGDSSGALVQGNWVGVAADGTTPCGNDVSGIGAETYFSAPLVTFGGTTPAARNVIGNSDSGVQWVSDCSGFLLQGNYIGLNPSGTSAIPSVGGVFIHHASGCVVGGVVPAARNVISGNTNEGISIATEATGIQVFGNYIGLAPSGTTAIPNALRGITIAASGNQIGGTSLAEANVISGNGIGIWFFTAGATGNIVGMNRIGTNASGTLAVDNTTGIRIENTSSNTITGSLISGNTSSGVEILGAASTGNTLAGNLIGTDVTGTAALPNGLGVLLQDTSGNQVGGPGAGDRNVISANGNNLVVLFDTATPAANVVEGNYFGTDVTGTSPLGAGASNVALVGATDTIVRGNIIGGDHTRGLRIVGGSDNVVQDNRIGVGASLGPIGISGPGILVEGSSSGNLIGGLPGEDNLIANNTEDGIRILVSSVRNAILGNAIFSNGGLGIDLAPAGVTGNDVGDADTGANNLQNFPTLTSAATTGGNVTVTGTLGSQVTSSYRVEFFSSPSCDPSGHGEGATYMGSTPVVTNGTGVGGFSVMFLAAAAAGEVVTATATDLPGNTSEFSACVAAVGVPPPAPTAVEFPSPLTLTWEAVPGASLYHIYVGTDRTLFSLASPDADACEADAVQTPGVQNSDEGTPPPGHMLWAVVTSEGLYGEGPPQPGSGGPADFSSTGPCGDSCAHDQCETGGPLEPACTPCASIVCDSDPACCTTGWNADCIQKVRTVCRTLSCSESAGQCAHEACAEGGPLQAGCDVPPLSVSCTAAICQVDPHCCQQAWDSACIAKVWSVCGYGCL